MSLLTINDCWSTEDYESVLNSSSENLWRFIQPHASVVEKNQIVENLTGLNSVQTRQLASIHLLLSKEIKDFIFNIAPNILRRISKSSFQRNEVVRGRIKGKVNWTKTVLKQRTEKDPTLFICSTRSPIFDLIENKVFFYCLHYIFQTGRGLIKRDLEVSESISNEYLNDLQKWMKEIEYIHLKCRSLLKSPLLREITELHGINMKHIQSTRKVRGREYKSLADAAELILTQKNQPLEFLNDTLSRQLLRPLSRDTLYEVAVAFNILETFSRNGWKEENFSLVGEKSKILSTLKKGNSRINIYYQSMPQRFVKKSGYKDLMKETGLSTHHRRPDILLEWINEEDAIKYTIIEVKRSQNRSYLADGVYKVLGYLKDFELALQDSSHSVGLLVGWRIDQLQSPKKLKEVYTSDWGSLYLYLNQIEENMNDFLSIDSQKHELRY